MERPHSQLIGLLELASLMAHILNGLDQIRQIFIICFLAGEFTFEGRNLRVALMEIAEGLIVNGKEGEGGGVAWQEIISPKNIYISFCHRSEKRTKGVFLGKQNLGASVGTVRVETASKTFDILITIAEIILHKR